MAGVALLGSPRSFSGIVVEEGDCVRAQAHALTRGVTWQRRRICAEVRNALILPTDLKRVPESVLSLAHIVLSIVSLIIGAFIFFTPKGTALHKSAGKIYTFAMIGLNASALAIYHLTGHFNLFHLTAILSLILVLVGWMQVIFRRHLRKWLYRHYVYMSWSYLALVAAAFNEGFVRVEPLMRIAHRYGNWVIIASQGILIATAAILINRNKQRMLALR
jgi:uncharacterized membrane protein